MPCLGGRYVPSGRQRLTALRGRLFGRFFKHGRQASLRSGIGPAPQVLTSRMRCGP